MSFNILLVDDSPTDVAILQASFESFTEQCKIRVLTSGVEMAQLMEEDDPDTYLPHLVLLDLNLPHKFGHEILKDLRANKAWRLVPVIILSSSSSPTDITKSYALSANAYITKPKSFDGYEETAQRIYDFWIRTVTLPSDRET